MTAPYDLWVDFNDIQPDGTTTSLAGTARDRRLLIPETSLVVGDDDGNSCYARVVRVEKSGIVVLQLDMGAFKPSKEESALRAALDEIADIIDNNELKPREVKRLISDALKKVSRG